MTNETTSLTDTGDSKGEVSFNGDACFMWTLMCGSLWGILFRLPPKDWPNIARTCMLFANFSRQFHQTILYRELGLRTDGTDAIAILRLTHPDFQKKPILLQAKSAIAYIPSHHYDRALGFFQNHCVKSTVKELNSKFTRTIFEYNEQAAMDKQWISNG